jgi:hypothetical protein
VLADVTGELRDSTGWTWALQGTLASRAQQKRSNAKAERLLVCDVEPWIACAWYQTGEGRDTLRFCQVSGPAMEPALHDGDVVMLDMAQAGLIDGGIYAIQYGREIRVRKLFSTLGSGVRVHCANPEYPDEVIDPAMGSFNVLGRVVWRGG